MQSVENLGIAVGVRIKMGLAQIPHATRVDVSGSDDFHWTLRCAGAMTSSESNHTRVGMKIQTGSRFARSENLCQLFIFDVAEVVFIFVFVLVLVFETLFDEVPFIRLKANGFFL